MQISPAGIGKISGLVLIVLLVVVGAFLLQPKYSISGFAKVRTVDYSSPCANIKVYLMPATVEDELQRMVADYSAFQSARVSQAVASLLMDFESASAKAKEATLAAADDELLDIQNLLQDGTKSNLPLSLKEKILLNLKSDPDQDELDEISERINLYNQNAEYCREQGQLCLNGQDFYEKSADYWQAKADLLKEKGRLVYDDATYGYKTVLSVGGGLGNESVQSFERVQIIDPELLELALAKVEPAPVEEKVEEVAVKEVAIEYDTNAVFAASVEIDRLLREDYHLIISETSKLLKNKIFQTEKTDIDGNYLFKGEAIEPGKYIVFAQYDFLTNSGEDIDFTWFKTINIARKRFAFKKNISLDLNEINQSKPATLNIKVPDQEDLYLSFCSRIEKNLKTSNSNK